MPPTLASLVHHSALKLTVRAGEDRLDVPVRWAHASELADPVPYMEGGELLLITALKLDAEDPEAMRRYVRRLAGAGVVGLGFAVGVHYEAIPQALVDAASGEGLPLLEVPRRTPFLAISKAVSAAIAAEQYRAVTAGFAAQRELTRQALTAGPEGLLGALAGQVDGWAALYDASGAVVAVAPEWAERRAGRLVADVERLRDRPAPASAVVGGEDRVELHSLGTGRRARAALAVGTAAALGTAERYAVHSAIALLTLTTERSRPLYAAEQRIGAAVLRMLLAGECDHARAVAGDLYGDLLDAPFRLILAEAASASAARARVEGAVGAVSTAEGVAGEEARAAVAGGGRGREGARASGAGGAAAGVAADVVRVSAGGAVGGDSGGELLGQLVEVVEAAAARAGEAVLVVPDGERLVVLAVDGGAAVAACGEFAVALETARAAGRDPVSAGASSTGAGVPGSAAAGGPVEEEELVVGLSAPAGPIAAAAAYKQAEQALSVARRRGRCLVEHEELAAGSVLPLLGDDAVRAFADSLLRPLREHDATGRGDLVASLRAWLSRHGQWDAAAADLGVHRHTLRYRMRRVEEIVGRSLDDPDVRMELWLALKATAAAGE
ncbi:MULTISPECIES: PucR family transcriptional regulator [Streptomyces]|uniref:PucR family transcriptional regulator n=1 Tax=Streptomyces caniscabiei TaxID=2746961 RepID=A0ABU4MPJ3_9ACTN|nr:MULTISPECIES: PucR family transcriptional regulator [Streptomyces]MBE4735821.1 PucR family transcriptional regulator [Streptomyces caniscabiei]MBE4758438.1 PucR family transcriptional regulator [Streptomyces caniscabiei]MBE4774182.1 PucR family transcriptional regulator [Streptomyces caniscabiei]MBE4788529.1 PucR family transcriptional regulator [Streptomyces caniscabiei]MBE4796237.1 PucR family transcriptional regulator [Streptomyces caniscabiei]